MYKVGDRVRIIQNLEAGNFYSSNARVTDSMIKFAGIVTEIAENCEDGTYELLCDNREWYWPEKTLTSYPETNGDNIRGMTDEQLAKFLIGFKNTFGEEYEGEMSCLDWLRKPME